MERNDLLSVSQTYACGGRGRKRTDFSILQYPVMKENDILEIVSLRILQLQLKIPDYDDMEMLRERFNNPPSQFSDDTIDVKCIDDSYLSGEADVPLFSLQDENLCIMNKQYSYIDFLSTLEEKECFVVIEHVPSEEVTNIEALVTSFGEIIFFRDNPSRNENEKILLVKMSTISECNWVVSCLDGHLWGNKSLKATNVFDLFNDKICKTQSPSKVEDCIDKMNLLKGQFEEANDVASEKVLPVSKKDSPADVQPVCTENSPDNSQYLDLPSMCSLSHESIFIANVEHNYVEFLQTLDEKELYSVVEHIPVDADESLENLLLTFGNMELFHLGKSRNEKERIGLVKMEKPSQCDSVISCLNNSQWGENVLSIRKINDILSLL